MRPMRVWQEYLLPYLYTTVKGKVYIVLTCTHPAPVCRCAMAYEHCGELPHDLGTHPWTY